MHAFCINSGAFIPIAIHMVNRIQVRGLSFIMRNTLMRILALGVRGTKGTYTTIKHQSYFSHSLCSFYDNKIWLQINVS